MERGSGKIQEQPQSRGFIDFDKHATYFFPNNPLESWISHRNHSPQHKRGLCISKQALPSFKPSEPLEWKDTRTPPYMATSQ